jgi:RNA recognition motif-containing protein
MNIYVGNIPFDTTTEEIQQLFAASGTIIRVQLISDRFTKRPKGFGFVEMEDDQEAHAAIASLDGLEFKGHILQVHEARPRETGGSRGGLGRRKIRWSR